MKLYSDGSFELAGVQNILQDKCLEVCSRNQAEGKKATVVNCGYHHFGVVFEDGSLVLAGDNSHNQCDIEQYNHNNHYLIRKCVDVKCSL